MRAVVSDLPRGMIFRFLFVAIVWHGVLAVPPSPPLNTVAFGTAPNTISVWGDPPASNGSSPLRYYNVTSLNVTTGIPVVTAYSPGVWPIRIPNLVHGVVYQFVVVAVNEQGFASAPSNATVAIAAGSASSRTFQLFCPRL